jgi:xanthine/uracil permease
LVIRAILQMTLLALPWLLRGGGIAVWLAGALVAFRETLAIYRGIGAGATAMVVAATPIVPLLYIVIRLRQNLWGAFYAAGLMGLGLGLLWRLQSLEPIAIALLPNVVIGVCIFWIGIRVRNRRLENERRTATARSNRLGAIDGRQDRPRWLQPG